MGAFTGSNAKDAAKTVSTDTCRGRLAQQDARALNAIRLQGEVVTMRMPEQHFAL